MWAEVVAVMVFAVEVLEGGELGVDRLEHDSRVGAPVVSQKDFGKVALGEHLDHVVLLVQVHRFQDDLRDLVEDAALARLVAFGRLEGDL